MKHTKLWIYCLILCLPAKVELVAQDQNDVLFHIERSRDADMIYYEARLNQAGQLDPKEPIKIYWIKHSKNNQHAPLTRIQNRFGYGIHYISIAPHEVVFHLVSVTEQALILRKNGNGQFRVFANTPQGEIQLSNISIYFANESFWSPDINRLYLYGISTETGEYINYSFTK